MKQNIKPLPQPGFKSPWSRLQSLQFSTMRQALADAVLQNSRYAAPVTHKLIVFVLIAMPLSMWVEAMIAPDAPSTIPLRLAAMMVAASGLLISKQAFETQLLAASIWCFGVSFIGIFMFSSFVVLNAAQEPSTNVPTLWLLQYVVGLFVTMQLMANPLLLALCWGLATAASFLTLLFLPQVAWEGIRLYVLYPAPVVLTALVFGSATIRQTAIIEREKLLVAYGVGATTAHELRTPLASIRNFANAIQQQASLALEGFEAEKTQEARSISAETAEQLRAAAQLANRIIQETTYSFTVIDMLLYSTTKEIPADHAADTTDAFTCIKEAVERYPYASDAEKRLVTTELQANFSIRGSQQLVVHILFNLIKNAIRFAMSSEGKQIRLSSTFINQKPQLIVHNTGGGISEAQQREVFKRFYTTNPFGQGTGIGLSFCKMAMESLGGSIECRSDGSTYTEFRMHFPAIALEAGSPSSSGTAQA